MKFCFLSELFGINIVTGVDSCKPEEEEPGRNFRDDRAGAIILTMGIILILDAFVTNVHQDDNKDDADEDDFDQIVPFQPLFLKLILIISFECFRSPQILSKN